MPNPAPDSKRFRSRRRGDAIGSFPQLAVCGLSESTCKNELSDCLSKRPIPRQSRLALPNVAGRDRARHDRLAAPPWSWFRYRERFLAHVLGRRATCAELANPGCLAEARVAPFHLGLA